jgi:rubrerythrin
MEDNLIIAKSLLEWTMASKTEFLELSDSDSQELIAIAKKRGVPINSPDISLFRTVYAEIGVPNGNGVLLNRGPVEKGLDTLNFKQINLNHNGAGQVCGFILDSKISKNFVIVYGAFYKSLFKEKFSEIKKKFEDGELFVSFEIYNVNPETQESVIKIASDGTRVIDPIIFHGMGLLTSKPPACPRAKVTALLANLIDEKVVEEAEKIVVDYQMEDNISYAELSLPCLNCQNCQYKNKEMNMTENQIDDAKKIGEPIDPNLFIKADGTLDEEKIEAALPKEVTSRVKELIKEGKAPADAVKQAWKEHKEKADQSDEDQKKAKEKLAKEKAEQEEADRLAKEKADLEAVEKAKFDEAKAYVVAHWPREGNQNWTCPDCAFTFPLLSSETPAPQYCARCGHPYYSESDERPCEAEMSS